MRFSGNIVKKRQVLVGQRLTLCRRKAGLSKSALARLAGVSAADVVRELLADVPNPDRAAL